MGSSYNPGSGGLSYTFNPSTREAEAGGSPRWRQKKEGKGGKEGGRRRQTVVKIKVPGSWLPMPDEHAILGAKTQGTKSGTPEEDSAV